MISFDTIQCQVVRARDEPRKLAFWTPAGERVSFYDRNPFPDEKCELCNEPAVTIRMLHMPFGLRKQFVCEKCFELPETKRPKSDTPPLILCQAEPETYFSLFD